MSPYLRYSDNVEAIQPEETAINRQIVESMAKVNCAVFDRHRHASRDAHAKSHGILKGELIIESDLPSHLAQGLFAQPGRYSVIIRLSSSPGEVGSDAQSAARGFALKILGVPGEKVLAKDASHSQDFLLVNSPTIPFGDARAYQQLQNFLEAEEHRKHGCPRGIEAAPPSVDPRLKPILAELASANFNHLLGETFYSMAAIRFGDYVAKICVAPASAEVRALTGVPINMMSGESVLRDSVVDFFRKGSAEYELRAQLCTDTDAMPIEDASVEWSTHVSPYQTVGRIVIPSQEAYSPARRVYGDDVLSFNPWHAITAHRPLGSIMRIRKLAYEQSSSYRHAMNVQPRVEPSTISDFPD
jgi:hypothetical protein